MVQVMKLLTKKTDYAIRAVCYLADNQGRLVPSKEIAEREKIPLPYLRRLLPVLIGARIIASKEGLKGGLRLIKKPASVKIADIVTLFDGRIQISECMFRKSLCKKRATCVLRKRILAIEKKIIREFSDLSVGRLLADIRKMHRSRQKNNGKNIMRQENKPFNKQKKEEHG